MPLLSLLTLNVVANSSCSLPLILDELVELEEGDRRDDGGHTVSTLSCYMNEVIC